jgi:hypothetical protein
MVTIKFELPAEREEALRTIVRNYGGAMNAYFLPFVNAVIDGTLVMSPQLLPPKPEQKKA